MSISRSPSFPIHGFAGTIVRRHAQENRLSVDFENRQAKLKVVEALELRAKQFRGRQDIWPFRVPHEPLHLEEIIDRAVDGEGMVNLDALRSRTVLELSWGPHRWELWVLTLPSGILLYCDSGDDETRVLASAKRGNPGEADGFFLERLAESRGDLFGIEMSGPAPDGVRSSIGDRGFLADVFVELFEGTEAARTIDDEPAADFHTTVERWLERVLTAPPHTRRQKRLEAALAER
jgi:hypothetical protein